MILEEFVNYYHKNKSKKKQAKEILISWLKAELTRLPQKNYQKVLHSEITITSDERIIPKNKQGENLLSSLLRMINILEEKEFESWVNSIKPKDLIHA